MTVLATNTITADTRIGSHSEAMVIIAPPSVVVPTVRCGTCRLYPTLPRNWPMVNEWPRPRFPGRARCACCHGQVPAFGVEETLAARWVDEPPKGGLRTAPLACK